MKLFIFFFHPIILFSFGVHLPVLQDFNFSLARFSMLNSIPTWVILIIICFLFLIIGFLLSAYPNYQKTRKFLNDLYTELEYENSDLSRISLWSISNSLIEIRRIYRQSIGKLTNDNILLQNELKAISKPEVTTIEAIDKVSEPTEYLDGRAKVVELDISNEIIKTELYFSIPENDGSFIHERGSSESDEKKYYKIEFFTGSNQGDLFYQSGNDDKRAINRLDTYLKPVCDIEGILKAGNASKIVFVEKGKVKKLGEKWIIDLKSKVKIRLE